MKHIKPLLLIAFLITSIVRINAQFGIEGDLVKVEVFTSFDKLHKGSEFKIAVKAEIENTWHINSNTPNEDFLIPSKLEIVNESGFEVAEIKFPKAHDYEFEFSEVPVSVFEGTIYLGARIRVPESIEEGTHNLKVVFSYQACNDATCLAPAKVEKEIEVEVANNQTPVNQVNAEIVSKVEFVEEVAESKGNNDDSLASLLESSGLFLSLFFVFMGGLALNLTPCVYPLIPITVGYFGGQSEGRTGKLFVLGLFYVLGMAITYSLVGVVTSLSGAIFGALLQNPITIIAIVAVLLALSLSMFGVYEFKLPDSWVMKAGGAKSGVLGALFMGLTMGIVAAPCIGPFVLSLVTFVGVKGDPFYGFIMFFFLAVGLGTPYLFLALLSGKIKSLPKAGFWMEAIKHIFGFILIGMAIYFLEPLLPKSITAYLLPVFMILAALYLLFFDKLANDIIGFKIFKIIFSVLIIALGTYLLWPVENKSPDWLTYSDQAYEASLQSNKKIMLDFYADWCIPCKEYDKLTFTDQRIIDLSKEFDNYKLDLTKTMSEETERIRNKFEIVGMPTIILIDSQGNEVERITGFLNAKNFLDVMSKIN